MPNFHRYKNKSTSGYIKWNRWGKGVETYQITSEGLQWLSVQMGEIVDGSKISNEMCKTAANAGYIYVLNEKVVNYEDPNQMKFENFSADNSMGPLPQSQSIGLTSKVDKLNSQTFWQKLISFFLNLFSPN